MTVFGTVMLFVGALAVFGAFFAKARLTTNQSSGLYATGSALMVIGLVLTIQ